MVRSLHFCAVLVAASVPAAMPAVSATSGSVVGATVLASTEVDLTGCAGGSNGHVPLGAVAPGASVVSAPCVIGFGSSNSSSRLELFRAFGTAAPTMRGLPTGSLDTVGFGGGTGAASIAGVVGDRFRDAAVQPDGRIVVVGTLGNETLVARFLDDGTLDPAFTGPAGSASGWFTLDIPGDPAATGMNVELDGDGRSHVAINANDGVSRVARFTSTGALDTTWAGTGMASWQVHPGAEVSTRLALAPDGDVVVAGAASATGDAALTRLDATGRLDSSFGGDGIVTTSFGTAAHFADVAIQPDGRIVAGGGVDGDELVARYLATGTLDTAGFNAPTGWRADDACCSDNVHRVALLPDGRIAVVAYDAAGSSASRGRRLLSTGAEDPSWTASYYPEGVHSAAPDVLVGPDGSLTLPIVGGLGTVFRRSSTGAADTSFGSGGSSAFPGLSAGSEEWWGIAQAANGRVVVVGAIDGDPGIAMLATADSISDLGPGNDWSTPGAGMFGSCLQSVAGATAGWVATGTCGASDADPWRAIPSGPGVPAAIVATRSSAGTGTATVRFGLRVPAMQSSGRYVANVGVVVMAP
jgi:uncharacterized delta-60 repeat protein